MDDDEYALINKKPLKLTGKKAKKTTKKSHKDEDDPLARISEQSKVIVTTATEAEKAFKSRQKKIAQERILKKASKTHKQRVEDFNKHLDSLSEHYDIPKVSWTK